MFINCYAYPSVWVITRGKSTGIYFALQDSNWSLELSLHDIWSPSASESNPQSHLPCRLKSPKCMVHDVTQKQLTHGAASVCVRVRARVVSLNMNVAPDWLRGLFFFFFFFPGYSVRPWRCWQLWDARQQLGKHGALTSLSATYCACVRLERAEREYMNCAWVCVIHTCEWRSESPLKKILMNNVHVCV